MPTLDSQVHAYERNHPGRPWAGVLHGPAEVTGDQMVAAMDAVSVDGAVLVSPFSMYRYDASYALQVYAAHPSGFRPPRRNIPCRSTCCVGDGWSRPRSWRRETPTRGW